MLIELYQDGTQISELLDNMTSGTGTTATATGATLTDAKLRRDVALEGRIHPHHGMT